MSKKHHFVPQSILKNFSVDGHRRQVVVFDKTKLSSYVSSVSDAGSENHFNTISIGGRMVCFEDAFQKCDDWLAVALRKLLAQHSLRALSDAERFDLAHVIAIQMGRTQFARQTFVDMGHIMDEATQRITDGAAQMRAALSDNEARAMAVRALGNARKWAAALIQKNWSLNIAPKGSEFWTSDNPVVRSSYLPHGDSGLLSTGVTISMPVSSDCVLEMMCPSIANKMARHDSKTAAWMQSSPTHSCSRDNVLFFNAQQVLQSLRFLYGPSKNFADARWILAENPDACGPRRIVEDGAVSPATMERMPPGCWLVACGVKTFHMLQIAPWEEAEGGLLAQVSDAFHGDIADLLADGPFSHVKLVKDKTMRWTLSAATIRLRPGPGALLEIGHAAAGIREAMRRRPTGGDAS